MEAFRPGYPRYTALLSTHPAFHNFRRFTRTRMRLLLLKQDQISMLEESLDRIDTSEDRDLFLGCSRRDGNAARQQTLQELKNSLAEYGTSDKSGISRTRMANLASDGMVEQNRRVMSVPASNERDIQSLRNWVQGTSSLARQETCYLESDDLANITGSTDNAITRMESKVEDCAFWLTTRLRRVSANRSFVIQPISTS